MLIGKEGKFLSADAINFVYAVLATIAAVIMFIPRYTYCIEDTYAGNDSFLIKLLRLFLPSVSI